MPQLTQPFSSRNAILAFITPPLAPAPPPPPDQLIELAIVVHRQGCECLIGQACRVGASLEGKIADVATSLAENTDHRSTAVIAPLENRRGQGHEPPEQIEGCRRIRLRDRLDDGSALNFEIIGQGSRALPVYKRARPRYDREPLAYLLGEFG